jgi:hypothetical protein
MPWSETSGPAARELRPAADARPPPRALRDRRPAGRDGRPFLRPRRDRPNDRRLAGLRHRRDQPAAPRVGRLRGRCGARRRRREGGAARADDERRGLGAAPRRALLRTRGLSDSEGCSRLGRGPGKLRARRCGRGLGPRRRAVRPDARLGRSPDRRAVGRPPGRRAQPRRRRARRLGRRRLVRRTGRRVRGAREPRGEAQPRSRGAARGLVEADEQPLDAGDPRPRLRGDRGGARVRARGDRARGRGDRPLSAGRLGGHSRPGSGATRRSCRRVRRCLRCRFRG